MARMVESLTAEPTAPIIKSEWMNGEKWECSRQEDFPTLKVRTFRAYLYRAAEEHGKEVQTRLVGGSSIRFQFFAKGQAPDGPLDEPSGKVPAMSAPPSRGRRSQ